MGEGAEGRGVFGLSAGARFARPPLAYPVGGTGEGGPLIRHGIRRDTFPPQGGRLWGRLEACGRSWASAQGWGLPPPVSGMFCDWYGGRRTPHPPRLAPPHLPPTGGRLLGRLEACGRFWASAQGRGLPPPVSGMFCDWYGGRRPPHPPRLAPPHLPPTGGKAFGAGHGVLMDHERKRPDLLRVRPLFYSFSNR